MKFKAIILIVILVFALISIFSYAKDVTLKDRSNIAYMTLCEEPSNHIDDSTKWYFVIYLDINACLTCTDHIPSWIILEKQLPKYRSKLLIFTNHRDSLDVAIAMKLEGFTTSVRIIDKSILETLRWNNKNTPIKILLDSNYIPLLVIEPFGSENEAERFYKKLLDEISSE